MRRLKAPRKSETRRPKEGRNPKAEIPRSSAATDFGTTDSELQMPGGGNLEPRRRQHLIARWVLRVSDFSRALSFCFDGAFRAHLAAGITASAFFHIDAVPAVRGHRDRLDRAVLRTKGTTGAVFQDAVLDEGSAF